MWLEKHQIAPDNPVAFERAREKVMAWYPESSGRWRTC
jgi:hypothetical protein